MDGQQRITAIRNFYENDLALRGLDIWPELNGRKYSTLPERIRAGIDRRSISYIVLLKESAETDEEALLLKQLVFGRLNTGGVALTQQELRNSLYQGPFNELLFELAAFQRFREAWGLPRPTENERVSPPAELLRNTFFVKMEDVELVLRFFALRHVSHYQRGMQGFLNLYMIRAQAFEPVDLAFLRSEFISTMTTAAEIFGDLVFRPFDVKKGEWATRPQKAFYDAVMVGLSRNAEHFDLLRRRREQVIDGTRHLFINNEEGTFTGRGNSKSDIETRIGLFSTMLQLIVQA
jgi:hypothetical protein